MINWKSVKDHTPTNVDRDYPGHPETPFVSCLVWCCNPEVIEGGVIEVCRWDTKNKCWHEPDKMGKWIFEEPYQITHFSDERNVPETL